MSGVLTCLFLSSVAASNQNVASDQTPSSLSSKATFFSTKNTTDDGMADRMVSWINASSRTHGHSPHSLVPGTSANNKAGHPFPDLSVTSVNRHDTSGPKASDVTVLVTDPTHGTEHQVPEGNVILTKGSNKTGLRVSKSKFFWISRRGEKDLEAFDDSVSWIDKTQTGPQVPESNVPWANNHSKLSHQETSESWIKCKDKAGVQVPEGSVTWVKKHETTGHQDTADNGTWAKRRTKTGQPVPESSAPWLIGNDNSVNGTRASQVVFKTQLGSGREEVQRLPASQASKHPKDDNKTKSALTTLSPPKNNENTHPQDMVNSHSNQTAKTNVKAEHPLISVQQKIFHDGNLDPYEAEKQRAQSKKPAREETPQAAISFFSGGFYMQNSHKNQTADKTRNDDETGIKAAILVPSGLPQGSMPAGREWAEDVLVHGEGRVEGLTANNIPLKRVRRGEDRSMRRGDVVFVVVGCFRGDVVFVVVGCFRGVVVFVVVGCFRGDVVFVVVGCFRGDVVFVVAGCFRGDVVFVVVGCFRGDVVFVVVGCFRGDGVFVVVGCFRGDVVFVVLGCFRGDVVFVVVGCFRGDVVFVVVGCFRGDVVFVLAGCFRGDVVFVVVGCFRGDGVFVVAGCFRGDVVFVVVGCFRGDGVVVGCFRDDVVFVLVGCFRGDGVLVGCFRSDVVLVGCFRSDVVLVGCFRSDVVLVGCLRSDVVVVGCFRRDVVVVGCFRSYVVVVGCFRSDVVVVGCFRSDVVVVGCFRSDVVVVGCFRRDVVLVGCFRSGGGWTV
ncbi:hypothetical protein ACOMHN_041436 [Nucella lapillus]